MKEPTPEEKKAFWRYAFRGWPLFVQEAINDIDWEKEE